MYFGENNKQTNPKPKQINHESYWWRDIKTCSPWWCPRTCQISLLEVCPCLLCNSRKVQIANSSFCSLQELDALVCICVFTGCYSANALHILLLKFLWFIGTPSPSRNTTPAYWRLSQDIDSPVIGVYYGWDRLGESTLLSFTGWRSFKILHGQTVF